MHIAVNTKLDVRNDEKNKELQGSQILWYLAEEAYELEEYEKVERLVSKVLN